MLRQALLPRQPPLAKTPPLLLRTTQEGLREPRIPDSSATLPHTCTALHAPTVCRCQCCTSEATVLRHPTTKLHQATQRAPSFCAASLSANSGAISPDTPWQFTHRPSSQFNDRSSVSMQGDVRALMGMMVSWASHTARMATARYASHSVQSQGDRFLSCG